MKLYTEKSEKMRTILMDCWHMIDEKVTICFTKDIRVTIAARGLSSSGRYLSRQDDIASVAYWY